MFDQRGLPDERRDIFDLSHRWHPWHHCCKGAVHTTRELFRLTQSDSDARTILRSTRRPARAQEQLGGTSLVRPRPCAKETQGPVTLLALDFDAVRFLFG